MKRYLIKLLAIALCCGATQFFAANDGTSFVKKVFWTAVCETPSSQPEKESEEETKKDGYAQESEDAQAETTPGSTQSIAQRMKWLEIEGEGFNWRRDWWKYAIMFIIGVTGLALTVYVLKAFVKLLSCLVCIIFGSLGSLVFIATLTPWVSSWLSADWRWMAKSICGTCGFLLAYGLAGATMQYLRKPLKADLDDGKGRREK